eukprot:Skav233353  [mRNA]  locus=scaffold394:436291:437076:- [translate_table: standard]
MNQFSCNHYGPSTHGRSLRGDHVAGDAGDPPLRMSSRKTVIAALSLLAAAVLLSLMSMERPGQPRKLGFVSHDLLTETASVMLPQHVISDDHNHRDYGNHDVQP